tara:strand:+ start:6007 stop:6513 length:507 start_codon:yes stop_codon:yes gene_type:complete
MTVVDLSIRKLRDTAEKLTSDLVHLKDWVYTESKKQSLPALLQDYVEFHQVATELDKLTKEINKCRAQIKEFQIPERFDEEGVKTMTIETENGPFRLTVSQRVFASMKDRESGMGWLEINGHGELVTPTVNASTLSAWAKSQIEEGEELPEEVFNVTYRENTSVTKVK